MSNWNADPSSALWYGEVVFGSEYETDYNYAYSSDTEEPDPGEIPIPDGFRLLESTVLPTHNNPYHPTRCGRW